MFFIKLLFLSFGVGLIAAGISDNMVWLSALGGAALGTYHSLNEKDKL